jgi:hypothetical protein
MTSKKRALLLISSLDQRPSGQRTIADDMPTWQNELTLMPSPLLLVIPEGNLHFC